MRIYSFILIVALGCFSLSCDRIPWTGGSSEEAEVVFLLEKRGFSTGETIQFINRTTGSKSFTWDFGDGSTSTEYSPVHIYSYPGDYYPILTAKTQGGLRSFQYKITISGDALIPKGETAVNTDSDTPVPEINSGIRISLSAKVEEIGKIISYSCDSDTIPLYWEFEDGKHANAIEGEYIFDSPGRKLIMLYGDDQKTLIDSTSVQIYSATIQPVNIIAEEKVSYEAEAEFEIKWDFGEGEILETAKGAYSFVNPGKYSVKLMDGEDRLLKTFNITVIEPLDASVLDAMFNKLGNEGRSDDEKDKIVEQLYSKCSSGKATRVSGKASGKLEDFVLQLRIQSDNYTTVSITTNIEQNREGKITKLEITQYKNVSN